MKDIQFASPMRFLILRYNKLFSSELWTRCLSALVYKCSFLGCYVSPWMHIVSRSIINNIVLSFVLFRSSNGLVGSHVVVLAMVSHALCAVVGLATPGVLYLDYFIGSPRCNCGALSSSAAYFIWWALLQPLSSSTSEVPGTLCHRYLCFYLWANDLLMSSCADACIFDGSTL
jgi:hypothetical protein